MTSLRVAAAPLLALCSLLGCHRPVPGEVARVGGEPLTREDLAAAQAGQAPGLRDYFSSAAGQQQLVEALVDDTLLAQEARRLGLDTNPEIRASVRRLLAEAVLRQFKQVRGPSPEAAARAYYDAHQSEFQQPERVSVLRLVLPETRRGDPKARARAGALVKQLQQKHSLEAFRAAAMSFSGDGASRFAGGALGEKTRAELAAAVGSDAAEAAWRASPGAVVGPVESPAGLELLYVVSHAQASTRSFEEARPALEASASADEAMALRHALVSELRMKTSVSLTQAGAGSSPVTAAR